MIIEAPGLELDMTLLLRTLMELTVVLLMGFVILHPHLMLITLPPEAFMLFVLELLLLVVELPSPKVIFLL
jgi:hypothetical protein